LKTSSGGSAALVYLAAAGLGTLGIADDDMVALSNGRRGRLVRGRLADGHGGIGEFARSQPAGGELDFCVRPEIWGNLLPAPGSGEEARGGEPPGGAGIPKVGDDFSGQKVGVSWACASGRCGADPPERARASRR
jgi:hypothetical protein